MFICSMYRHGYKSIFTYTLLTKRSVLQISNDLATLELLTALNRKLNSLNDSTMQWYFNKELGEGQAKFLSLQLILPLRFIGLKYRNFLKVRI
jgi:hypothetical protein